MRTSRELACCCCWIALEIGPPEEKTVHIQGGGVVTQLTLDERWMSKHAIHLYALICACICGGAVDLYLPYYLCRGFD